MNSLDSLLTKIQNKFKNYCEFQNICPAFHPDNFTCTNNGGSHCGKYRRFRAEKITKQLTRPKETV